MEFLVSCDKCGEEITVRADKEFDLEKMYTQGRAPICFRLRKEILGQACRNLMMLEVCFDKDYNIISTNTNGCVLK